MGINAQFDAKKMKRNLEEIDMRSSVWRGPAGGREERSELTEFGDFAAQVHSTAATFNSNTHFSKVSQDH